MGLFKIPTRNAQDIAKILERSREDVHPAIKVRGKDTTLATKLAAIAEEVKRKLGHEEDNFLCITDEEELFAYARQAAKDGVIAIDTETDSLDSMRAHLVGACLCSESQKPAYIPVGHISTITEQRVEPQVSMTALKKALEIMKDSKLIFHNAYYDLVIIYMNTGIMLKVYWDTQVGSHVLNENESHNLKDLYVKYILEGNMKAWHFGELFDGIPFCYIPYLIAKFYAAKDADMTLKLFRFQEKYLTKGTLECAEYKLEGVSRLFMEDLMPMIPILVDMKLTGMEFDFAKAEELKKKYTKLKEEAIVKFNESLKPFEKEIKAYFKKPLPYPLNYNSSDQIRALFYDIAKIGVVYRKEPTGTGKNVLHSILSLDRFKGTPIRHVVECLSEVKMYDKALSSFIQKLSDVALSHGGKIHSDMNLCGTDTGRLSSSNPRHNWAMAA